MSGRAGNGRTRRRIFHPSVESAEEIERAKTAADRVIQTTVVTNTYTVEVLQKTLRKMPIGQLAHTLLNLHAAKHPYPERDYAVATVFIEKYGSKTVH